tara:strand:- start:505 stop:687 length:183 start_codon:yes stop_codon:yes gene_type:complete
MKTVTISDLKKESTEILKHGPALEVTSDGEFIGYFVIGVQGDMHHRIKGICSQIDAMRGV